MKKAYLVLLIIPFIFFESCKNDFNINAPNENVYVLNCILQPDSSIQYATITKNVYTQNGLPPGSNTITQYIKNASIKIYFDNSVFVMRDTTIQITNSGNLTQVNCYYVKNLTLPSGTVRIEATLPDGKILKSTTQVPQISFSLDWEYFPSVSIFAPRNDVAYDTLEFYKWSWIVDANTKILNLPELEVYYKKYDGGSFVDKKILVPLISDFFSPDSGITFYEEKAIPSYNNSCMASLKIINKTMMEISGNDPYKENYIITKVLHSVIGLDSYLSNYYFADKTYTETFTIKLTQPDFSNIEGGKGLFGALCKYSKPLIVDSVYVKSFGYRVASSSSQLLTQHKLKRKY